MGKEKCILLAFDSSTKDTGFAIFENGEFKKKNHVDESNIKDGQERLKKMMSDVQKIMDYYNPQIVTWETPVVVRNPQTQRDLSMLTGAIMGKCIEMNSFFCSFRPSEWRKLVASEDEKIPRKRDELKQWGKNKVKELYGFEVENDDESDAILIGLAYVNKFKE